METMVEACQPPTTALTTEFMLLPIALPLPIGSSYVA